MGKKVYKSLKKIKNLIKIKIQPNFVNKLKRMKIFKKPKRMNISYKLSKSL